jgi:hypothetical protein
MLLFKVSSSITSIKRAILLLEEKPPYVYEAAAR